MAIGENALAINALQKKKKIGMEEGSCFPPFYELQVIYFSKLALVFSVRSNHFNDLVDKR